MTEGRDPEVDREWSTEDIEEIRRRRKQKRAIREAAQKAKRRREILLAALFIVFCAGAVIIVSFTAKRTTGKYKKETTVAASGLTKVETTAASDPTENAASAEKGSDVSETEGIESQGADGAELSGNETDAEDASVTTENTSEPAETTDAEMTETPDAEASEANAAETADVTEIAETTVFESSNAAVRPTQGEAVAVQGGITIPSWITQDLLSVSPMHRTGEPIGQINYICVHYVANAGSSAKGNRDYFEENPDGRKVSSHFIVGLEGEILQCVPINELAYAQASAYTTENHNYDSISIENCHPDQEGQFNSQTYWSLVRLCAWLCEQYGLDQNALMRHYDMTGKDCPHYYVSNPGAWEQFKNAVGAYMQEHPDIAAEFP